MKRTLIAIAVVGTVFAGVSGTSQAAPIAPESCMCSHPKASVAQAHERHGRAEHKGSRRGGLFAQLGGLRSLTAMMGSGQGAGGLESMLGGMGGADGMQSMIAGMGGGAGTRDSQAARQACTPDAMRLCSDAIPDVARVKACMQAKSAQLSEPCRIAMNGAGGTHSMPAGRESDNFGGGQGYGNFEGGQGYDRFGAVQSLDSLGGGQGFDNFGGGQSGFDVGRLMGMARGMGFGTRDDWRD